MGLGTRRRGAARSALARYRYGFGSRCAQRLMERDEAGTLEALKSRRQNILAPRCAQSNVKDAPFAINAVMPTAPIVTALGSVPCKACQTTVPMIHKPNAPMVRPLTIAAVAR
jgi:hypothetical protein